MYDLINYLILNTLFIPFTLVVRLDDI